MLRFSTHPDSEDDVPVLGCGGSIEVLVERLTPDHVALLEELLFAGRDHEPVAAGAFARRLAPPHDHTHAECHAVTRDDRADPAVAVDAEQLVAQALADADLPASSPERRHLLRYLTHRRQDQSPCQLRRGVRRRIGVLARRDDDAAARTGIDIDVRIHASLADQPEIRQPLEQRRANLCPLADQDQCLRVAQPFRKLIDALHMIGPDRHVVSSELREAP